MTRLKISLLRLTESLFSSSAATSTGTSLYWVCATAGTHAESIKAKAGNTRLMGLRVIFEKSQHVCLLLRWQDSVIVG